jgi:UDP-N-acetylmuramate dehydrogenase
MLVDPDDPHSRSVGSFFVNPVIPEREYRRLAAATNGEIPSFPAEGGVKVPAAWLVEHAGFRRGYRRGSVGISANHALALVNYGGTSREVLALASEIQDAVFKHFAIRLHEEPVLVPADDR